jgi:hypothetical protein
MNRHLSSEQISQWMAGERTPDQEVHLQKCPRCAAELADLEATMRSFGDSVRRWSEQRSGAAPQSLRHVLLGHSRTIRPMRWALAVAALLIAVAIPFYRSAMNEQHQQELAKADAALLEQIDAEVSRAVPPPMEPLIELVAWDSTNTRGGVKRR